MKRDLVRFLGVIEVGKTSTLIEKEKRRNRNMCKWY